MRFILEKKTLNYLTIIFLGFLIYQAYKKEQALHAPNPNRDAYIERFYNKDEMLDQTKNKIKVDPEKKYSDYNMTEKFIYHFYKTEIEGAQEVLNKRKEANNAVKNQPTTPEVKPIRGVLTGDTLVITYTIKGDSNATSYNKQFILGNDSQFAQNTQLMFIGMTEGESKVIKINKKEIDANAKDEPVEIEVKLVKIN